MLAPIYKYIKVPTAISQSGTLEDFSLVINQLASDDKLTILILINGLLVGLAHAFGYSIIKYEDAVLQTTITLTIILFTWLFFIIWPFQGHEEFNVFTLVGMFLLGIGSYLYVVAAHKQNKEHNGFNDLDVDMNTLMNE